MTQVASFDSLTVKISVTGKAKLEIANISLLDEYISNDNNLFIDNDFNNNEIGSIPNDYSFTNLSSLDGVIACPTLLNHTKAFKFSKISTSLVTRTVTKTIDASGFYNDKITVSLILRCIATYNEILNLSFVFNYTDNSISESFSSDANKNNPNWQIISLGGQAKKDFSSISITLTFKGLDECLFTGLSIYLRKSFGKNIQYVNDMSFPSGINFVNKENNLIKDIYYENGRIEHYSYDNRQNVIEITDNLSNRFVYTYDDNDNNTSSNVYCSSSLIQNETYSYNDNNSLSSISDSFNNSTFYTYNYLNQITTISLSNNRNFNYSYDDRNNLLSVSYNNIANTNTYNNVSNIASSTSSNSSLYSFNYDNAHRLTSIIYNQYPLINYQYISLSNNNISSKTINNLTYNYIYNDDDLLVDIKANNIDRFHLFYNNDTSLAAIYDYIYGNHISFFYNQDNNISKIEGKNYQIRYEYNDDNEIDTSLYCIRNLNYSISSINNLVNRPISKYALSIGKKYSDELIIPSIGKNGIYGVFYALERWY